MPKQALILGGGFAGLAAARALQGAPCTVTLVDHNNYHLFQPLLYQVATGELQAEAIATPLRGLLDPSGIGFRLGRVLAIDPDARRVHLAEGAALSYDYLIIALGSVTNFFGQTELARHAFDLKGVDLAERTRSRILYAFERATSCTDASERAAWLTFVVAGGGATGVEFTTALLELIATLMRDRYPLLRQTPPRVLLIQGGQALLPGFAPALQEAAAGKIRALHGDILFGTHVTAYDGLIVHSTSADPLQARTLIWTAGIRAHPLTAALPGADPHSGRVATDPLLRITAHPEIFVVGDGLAGRDHALWPQVAPFAIQSGRYAGAAVRAALLGQALPGPFTYRDPGSMVVLGRLDAVCQIDRWRLRTHGHGAWLLWVGVHLYNIIGTRNRLLTLINWAIDYGARGNAVEIIRKC
ncbi:NAD(P)/FAD-dependent oxidoreductase [Acidiferrobacter sp.]|uniref:NAD(P)/FAD-dependent oxidoreductase n=1 Tax=Acidiferrobacter sp. TaxID=1872107 RepID=UPI00261080F1|nr:NAD(P)/FAD-dependent oxidoreductase [Acidiferrobacter sp.]